MDLPPPPPPVIQPPIPADSILAFAWVLQYVIGLDTQAKRDRVTVRAGVTQADDLLLVDTDSLLDCLTENTSVMAKTRLKALKLWTKEQFDIHKRITIHDFTQDVCKEKQMLIANPKSSTKTSSDSGSTKEKLRVFNGKRENWTNAKRELTAHLNQIINEEGVPIYYVIRDPESEQEYRANNGELGNMIYDAPFQGRIYDVDAFKVLQILRQWTSNGSAQTYVDQNNDVQDAWHK